MTQSADEQDWQGRTVFSEKGLYPQQFDYEPASEARQVKTFGTSKPPTPDELEQLLTFHMRWLHAKGLQPTNVVDRRQDIDNLVIVGEDDLIAYLLGESERSGIDIIEDVDVVNVVDAHLAYFEAIGAVGPKAIDL